MGWWKYAKPGDKVVAIVDGIHCKSIKRGNIYTIRDILPDWPFAGVNGRRMCGVRLYEFVRNPEEQGGFLYDFPVAADAFKPLQKSKTDISVFTSMLTKTRKENVRELEGVQ